MTIIAAPGIVGGARVAVVSGRKVGRAVQRNRAKRRLREAAARTALPSRTDYVIIADPETLTVPFDVLLESLSDAVADLEKTG